MNTNNTLKDELKKYLRGGELVHTSMSLETMLNEVLDELKNEEKINQEKIQKARDLDAISEAILNYFNKYYPAADATQEKVYTEMWSRDGLEALFSVFVEVFEIFKDENIQKIVDNFFDFSDAGTTTASSTSLTYSDKDSVAEAITKALADLGKVKNTSTSVDAIGKFCEDIDTTIKKNKTLTNPSLPSLWKF